ASSRRRANQRTPRGRSPARSPHPAPCRGDVPETPRLRGLDRNMSTSLKQYRRNARRREIREGAGQHRPHTETREIVTPLGHKRADAADLNPDRREVREAAERERRDRERPRIECGLHRTELRKCDELIEHHPCAEQIADRERIPPGDTKAPGDGGKDPAE